MSTRRYARAILKDGLDDLKAAGRGIGRPFQPLSDEEAAKRGRRGTGPCPAAVLELAYASSPQLAIFYGGRAVRGVYRAVDEWIGG
jgi:hypothetical protein